MEDFQSCVSLTRQSHHDTMAQRADLKQSGRKEAADSSVVEESLLAMRRPGFDVAGVGKISGEGGQPVGVTLKWRNKGSRCAGSGVRGLVSRGIHARGASVHHLKRRLDGDGSDGLSLQEDHQRATTEAEALHLTG